MKTKLTLMALLLMSSMQLKAQLSTGVMGGFSSETVSISNIPYGVTTLVRGQGIVGEEAGVFLKFKILPFYIKPEAMLHYANGTVLVQYEDNNYVDANFSYLKAEVPVMFGLNLLGPLNIEAGPVYNYNLFTQSNYNGQDIKVQPGGLGYRAGFDVQMSKIVTFDLDLQGQGNGTGVGSNDAVFRVPYSIVADLGFAF